MIEQPVRRRRRRNSPDADQNPRAAQASPAIIPALDIRPDGVYLPGQIREALKLKSSSLRTEWRRGRLRIIRRCGRNYLLGSDVLSWLNGGEHPAPSRRREPACIDDQEKRGGVT